MKIIKLSGVSLGTPIISPSRSLTHKAGRAVLVCLLTSLSGQALANPTGAQIVNGSVQINAIANQLNIHNSNGAIINWQNFSIGQQEITRFIQQNSTSAVLNRVVGQNPSAIMGQLLSNGHVFLLNPNGVVFGANAVVDTAGLIASSLNMSDESFLSGQYKFSGDASNGAVINRGLITAGKGGEIVLIAPTVENHGVISVEGGRILLAAGEKMTLSSLDLEGIEFEVQAPTNTAMNLGKLLASGGSVGVFAGSLTNTGVINANSVTKGKDGKLWLEASSSATVGGKLSAPDITIAGSDIALEGADISASAEAGGGQIRIGGDYQGVALGPNVSNAKSVTVDAATTISANAQTQGDGGRVIVWSDENTVVNGHISATGGSQSGNGGFVETSGKKALDFTTPVDVSATNGKAGTWLIDPEDIIIDESKASSIETALNAGSNVDIKTSDSGEGEGNITVAAAITKSEGDDATLSLDAHNKIDVNAPITSISNKLDVKLSAGNQVNVNSSITTNGGSVSTLITDTSTTADTPTVDPSTETVVEPVPDETAVPEETTEASTDTTPTETVVTVEETVAELNTSISGIIETSGGDISINAGETGSVLVEGTLDASNYEAGAIGGNIEVLGDQVELAGDALLDASGDAGGGTIKVGGDYQGQGDTPTATNTTAGEGVVIKADAVTEGDGGTVIVWSDDTTEFHGNISARGGEQGGNGGFAEVSGKQSAYVTGHADMRAPNGDGGTFLLDPGTINIDASAVAGPNTLGNSYIVAQLALGNFIISTSNNLQANGGDIENIYVDASINWNSEFDLTLDAGNINYVNASISNAGSGGLFLTAGVLNDINADISMNGGLIDATGGSGTVKFDNNGGTVTIDADLNATTINIVRGNAIFNGATSTSTLNQTAVFALKSLGGTGAVSVSGNYNWAEGDIDTTVNILNTATMNISAGNPKDLTGIINNSGTTIYDTNSGAVDFYINDGGEFNNLAGGVFDFQNNRFVTNNSGAGFFNNNGGTVLKSGASTSAGFTPGSGTGLTFTNTDGTLKSISGDLSIQSNSIFNGGLVTDTTGGGTVTLGRSIGTNTITFNNTTLTNNLRISSGIIAGNLTVANGSTLELLYSNTDLILTGVINNEGNTKYIHSSGITPQFKINDGGVFNNNGGVFDYQSSGTAAAFVTNDSGAGTFNNNGGTVLNSSSSSRISFSAGTGTGLTFTNNNGTLKTTAGSSITLSLDSTFTGNLILDAGAGGKINLLGFPATYTFNNATLVENGANDVLGFWGGTIAGTGLTIQQGATLEILDFAGNDKVLTTKIDNSGTILFQDAGSDFFINGGGEINNLIGGLFDFQVDGFIGTNAGNGAFNNNGGTVLKSTTTGVGGFSTSAGLSFNNTGGTLSSDMGTLRIQAAKKLSGTLNINGAGSVELLGNITIDGATVLASNGDNDTLLISGTIDAINGGSLTVDNGAILSMRGTVNNSAIINFDGNGNGNVFEMSAGSIFNNLASGIVDFRGNGVAYTSSGTSTINNSGIFRKTVSTGAAGLSNAVNFNNSGIVDIQTGSFDFGLNFVQGTGQTIVGDGLGGAATIQVAAGAGAFILNGGSIGGNGTLDGDLTLFSGTLFAGASTGTLNITGDLNLGSTSVVDVELDTASIPTSDIINVSGNVDFGGATLNVLGFNGYTGAYNDSFQIFTFGSNAGNTTFGIVNNSLTDWLVLETYNANDLILTLDADTNTWINPSSGLWTGSGAFWSLGVLPAFNHKVVIPEDTGQQIIVTLDNSNVEIANLTVSGDEVLSLAGGSLVIAGDSTVDGELIVGAGSTLTIDTLLDVNGVFTQNNGVVTGAGDLFIAQTANWNGGTQSGAGSTIVDGDLTFAGAATRILDGRTLSIDGPTVLAIGEVLTLQNNALLTGAGSFTNQGQFNVTDSTVNNIFINEGAVSIAGNTDFTSAYTQTTGSTSLAANSFLTAGVYIQNGGTLTLNSGSTISSLSTIDINGGTLSGTGTLFASAVNIGAATIEPGFSPGTINITGDLYLSAASILNFEVGPDATIYDILNVSGNLDFAGATLNINWLGGYAPADGDSYQMINYGSYSGVLNVNAPVILIETYNPTNLLFAFGIATPAVDVAPVPVAFVPVTDETPIPVLDDNIMQLVVAMWEDAFSFWVNDPSDLSSGYILTGAINGDNGDRESGGKGQKVYLAEWNPEAGEEYRAPLMCN